MLFTSYSFICFLALVLIGYYLIPKRCQWMFLLVASYIFYFLANPFYPIFILLTSSTIFFTAHKIERSREAFQKDFNLVKKGLTNDERRLRKREEKKRERSMMYTALFINLGILAVLKYTNFIIGNINGFFKLFSKGAPLSFVDIILPMGISFYTFQALGYLLDIYRNRYATEKNIFRFFLFISFFPQLVQGPISRYNDLSKTLYEPHRANSELIISGLQRILWGFFKKLVIADRILVAVNTIIRDPAKYSGAYVFLGMLFYALELYADFTGGIDITIGAAECMGIRIKENFQRPYFSKSIKEYWTRWHISMGTWFTDYVFYPVSVSNGMKRVGSFARRHFGNEIGKRVPVYMSAFLVWLATGIWHGASWNFIVWGLMNFVIIMLSEELSPIFQLLKKTFHIKEGVLYRLFQIIRTILFMSCLRLLDCYRDVPLTFRMFGNMITGFHFSVFSKENLLGLGLKYTDYWILLAGTAILILVSLIQRKGSVRLQIRALAFPWRFLIWYGLFLSVLLFGAYGIGYDENQFIYNQF